MPSHNRSLRMFALLVISGVTACAASVAHGGVSASVARNGRSFTIKASGAIIGRAEFSATVEIGGVTQELYSARGVLVAAAVRSTEATPYGSAGIAKTTIRFEKEGLDLLLNIGRVPGVPGILAQAGICNTGTQSVKLLSVTPVAMEAKVDGDPAKWLVTELNKTVRQGRPVVVLDALHEPVDVLEYGGLYRQDGEGFLFGPVGTPIAYVQARIEHKGGGNLKFHYSADMSGARVDPGETRWGQQVVLLVEPPSAALARWAEWVSKTHRARTDKGSLSGWSSWYSLGGKVAGTDVVDVAEAAIKSQDRLRPGVIEISQGFSDPSGKVETNPKFPEGLAFYAKRIAATGARPGLYLDSHSMVGEPSCIDSVDWTDIALKTRRAVQAGFTFLKLNLACERIRMGTESKKTVFEMAREGFMAFRAAAGDDIYLLHCDYQLNRATVGVVDASRTGVNERHGSVRTAIDDVLRSYQLNGRWFAVANDTYFMGTDIDNVSEVAGGWPLVRTWMSLTGMSCGLAITSDPWYRESFKPYWRNVEVMTPPARERTEVLDLCTSRDWPRLVGHVRRDWGDWTVALLWNPGATERTVTLDFAQAGLDPKRRYAVWSFWENRYLGVVEGSWTTPLLAPSASQHLCITDLDRTPNHPVVIGSSLHIYCGAAEIRKVTSTLGGLEVELTDAGARDGDLFVYSRWPPVLRSASGCRVKTVMSAGENVWRIELQGRQLGVPQRVELGILLPVSRQPWFWILIAGMVGSLAFAAWRYMIGLRVQHEHALEQERARIAKDLHDDLGANLTQIAYLGDSLLNRPGLAKEFSGDIDKICVTARELTRSLDETVWAVDPEKDTLDSLVGYLVGQAQEMLSGVAVNCRFDFPETLPVLPVSSDVRHHVFLAFKEALHNIIRHARATEVNVRFTLQSTECNLVIADNGCGFEMDSSGARPGGGHGLSNILKRLEAIGGRCEVKSCPGAGTELRLIWRLST